LEFSSLSKALHTRLVTGLVTKEEWAGSVIDSVLRELVPRGRQVYEEKRVQLSEVAHSHNILAHSSSINRSYDEMLELIA